MKLSFNNNVVGLSAETEEEREICALLSVADGHVFQLHFTNSTSMIEKGYITENVGDWRNCSVHFGFNVSRVFTVKRH